MDPDSARLTTLVQPVSAAVGAASVHLDAGTYPVTTDARETYYSAAFSGKKRPLCKYTSAKGCEDAVAVTSWQFQLDHGLYDAAGTRRKLDMHCDIKVLMPEWTNAHGEEAKRVHDFIAATKTHEMGHGAACLTVMLVIQAVMEHMPTRVAAADVAAFNSGFAEFVRDFYVSKAHEYDHKYDDHTAHGGAMQGAQLDNGPADADAFDHAGLSAMVRDASDAKSSARSSSGRGGGRRRRKGSKRRKKHRKHSHTYGGTAASILNGLHK